MRRRIWSPALIVALGMVMAPTADAATCGRNKAAVTDPKGDATAFAVFPSGFPNQPSLDVVSARLTWDAKTRSVMFRIMVDNLEDAAPAGANGKMFRFDFTYAGAEYELTARKVNVPPAETYILTVQTATTPATLDNTLKGKFDTKKEEVSILVPVSVFNAKAKTYWRGQNKPLPPAMAKGSKLSGFEILAQRYIGPGPAITATADEAMGKCTYVIG